MKLTALLTSLASLSTAAPDSPLNMSLLMKQKIDVPPQSGVPLRSLLTVVHQSLPSAVCIEQMADESGLFDRPLASDMTRLKNYGDVLTLLKKSKITSQQNRGSLILQTPGVAKQKTLPTEVKCDTLDFEGSLEEFMQAVALPAAESGMQFVFSSSTQGVTYKLHFTKGTFRDLLSEFAAQNPISWHIIYESNAGAAASPKKGAPTQAPDIPLVIKQNGSVVFSPRQAP